MKNHYKSWIIFSFVIVFSAGIFGGILLEKHIIDKRPRKISTSKKRSSVHFPTLDIMVRELNLNPEQQEQIRNTFNNNEERLKELRSQINKRFSSMRFQLLSEIKNVLNEEQGIKFEAMIEKYMSQRKKEMENRKNRLKKHKSEKGEIK